MFAQNSTTETPVDWSQAGCSANLPNPSIQVNIMDFGANNSGTQTNNAALAAAISNLNGRFGIIQFPPGEFLFTANLKLPDSVIVRGSGSDSTQFSFDIPLSVQNCFTIYKPQSPFWNKIVSTGDFGSSELLLEDSTWLRNGDWAEIRQLNGEWDTEPAPWAEYSVGQIVQIDASLGRTITLKQPLRTSLGPRLNPEIARLKTVSCVGIENLKIVRKGPATSSGTAYNIIFKNAANCWVKGVESEMSIASHIMINNSTNIRISGCYFHDAHEYDGAFTHGYGVTLAHHAGNCLVENNVFEHLRHAMMVKQGANGNVFAYNYSTDPYRSEAFHTYTSDISLHGHYAFANLFEGNIAQFVHLDQTWGPTGPINTLYRNRMEGVGLKLNQSASGKQRVIGNEITGSGLCGGDYSIKGNGHTENGNNRNGKIIPAGSSPINEKSMYLSVKPSFWDVSTIWPSIGGSNVLGSGTIPAKVRFNAGGKLTVDADGYTLIER